MILFKLMPRELAPVVDFQSRDAGAAELAAGSGAAHIHIVHIAAGGEIGHMSLAWSALPVPRGQRLGCERISISRGQVAYVARGERHSKGSTDGLHALIIQVHDLDLCAPPPNETLKLTR